MNSNYLILVKQKYFPSINTPNMLFKIIKQICYFFFAKIAVFVFYCKSAIFMTIFLPQEGKMWKFTGN